MKNKLTEYLSKWAPNLDRKFLQILISHMDLGPDRPARKDYIRDPSMFSKSLDDTYPPNVDISSEQFQDSLYHQSEYFGWFLDRETGKARIVGSGGCKPRLMYDLCLQDDRLPAVIEEFNSYIDDCRKYMTSMILVSINEMQVLGVDAEKVVVPGAWSEFIPEAPVCMTEDLTKKGLLTSDKKHKKFRPKAMLLGLLITSGRDAMMYSEEKYGRFLHVNGLPKNLEDPGWGF